jgi:hypothetical protein
MTAVDFAWWALLWGAGAVAFLRRPLIVLGLVAAGVLWTSVGPWAGWSALGAVAAAGLGARRRTGRGDARGLLGRPRVAAAALSAAVTVAAPGWWAFAGLVGLVASWAWWVRSAGYRLVVRRPATTPTVRRPVGARAEPAPAGRHLEVTTCDCGGLVVIEAHVAADPAGSVARATCGACGARFWGAVDPANPDGGAVWFEVPAGTRSQRGDRR